MERRRFPRKSCRIEADVSAEDASVRLPGKITDISLDGCYVEMLSPLPIDALIQVSLSLAEASLHVTGKVRYSQTGLGMGIEFMAMSPDDFERLRAFTPPGPGTSRGDSDGTATSQSASAVVNDGGNGRAAIQVMGQSPGGALCHLPTTAEALEVVVRVLSRKGVLTRDELFQELEFLKTAKA